MSESLREALASFKTRKRLPTWVAKLDLPELADEQGPFTDGERTRLMLMMREQPPKPAALTGGPELAATLLKAWGVQGKHHSSLGWLSRLGVLGDEGTAELLADKAVLLSDGQLKSTASCLDGLQSMGALPQLVRLLLTGNRQLESMAREALKPLADARGVTVGDLVAENYDWRAALLGQNKPKSLPSWLRVKELSLETADGPLDTKLLHGLLRAAIAGMLRPVVGPVRSLTTPESRDALCLALLDRWNDKGFHGRMKWIRGVVEAFGGDATALALEKWVVDWPSQGDTGRKRAIAFLTVFRLIGTDTALLVLLGLRQKVVAPSLIQAAARELKLAARDRKLDVGELKDGLTPSCGLDRFGTRSFDYGPREFQLLVDGQFRPRLRDAAGERLDTLPEPDEGDDASLVTTARAAWSVLDATLQEVMEVQAHRLEEDMVQKRRWSLQAWNRWVYEHPLMVHFARRLVWAQYRGDTVIRSFRVTEELEFVNAQDDPIELDDTGTIGVPHPLHLSDRTAWSEQLADYEVVQPFPQLGRQTFTADDASAACLVRFKAVKFSSGRLRDVLVLAEYEREPGLFRGWYEKRFGDLSAKVTLSPGVYAGGATYTTKDQTVPEVTFRRKSTILRLGDVPADLLSEVVRDLENAAAAS